MEEEEEEAGMGGRGFGGFYGCGCGWERHDGMYFGVCVT